jgi:2-dehydropantoate 2-reductase
MRFVIVGPGALGSVFAARLASGGHDVALYGRPSPHLDAIRARGLQLREQDETITTVSLGASDDPAVVSSAEALIVLVKTGDTAQAMQVIAPHVRADQVVLTLQNGLGNLERIRAALGPDPRILTGTTSQGAIRVDPGVVEHSGTGPTLIGYEGDGEVAVATTLARVFSAAGLPTAAVPDIERWLWRKVAVNAAINGLTALGGFRNGMIVSDPDLLDAAEVIAEEASAVARARGIELGNMRGAVAETAAATAANRSSMLQDIDAGRATEVDAIHGAILEAGREVGVATSAIQVLGALIRAKVQTRNTDTMSDG